MSTIKEEVDSDDNAVTGEDDDLFDIKKPPQISDRATQKVKEIFKKQVRNSSMQGKGPNMISGPTILTRVSMIKNFDYLALRSKTHKYHKRIQKLMERNFEDVTSPDFFSEYIKKIDTNYNKNKRILVITTDALYQLSKNLSVLVRVPLIDIKSITMIKKSSTLCAIHCPGSFDHLVEMMRRTEFIMFLIHVFDKRGLPRPVIYYADGLKLKKGGKKDEVISFDPAKKGEIKKDNLNLMRTLQSQNFLNSDKYGYLLKRSDSWFRDWTEKFCVVSNVGLIYYNDPDGRPRNLFPIIDAKITRIKEKVYKRKFCFRIKSFSWEIIFAAKTE